MVCSSHLDHAGQMLCTDFFCHPGTGSTSSRPKPRCLDSTARAQQHYTCCSWLAEGEPGDATSKSQVLAVQGKSLHLCKESRVKHIWQTHNPQKTAIATRHRLQPIMHREGVPCLQKGSSQHLPPCKLSQGLLACYANMWHRHSSLVTHSLAYHCFPARSCWLLPPPPPPPHTPR